MNMPSIVLVAFLVFIGGGLFFLQKTDFMEPSQEVFETVTKIEEGTDANRPTPTQGTNQGGSTLDLSNQGLTQVPESIFKRTDVTVLDLSSNALTGALQAEIRFMTNLVSLDVSNNNFTGVPAEVGQLSKLEYLNLSGNPLTGLPHELGNLKALKTLDLRRTNYSSYDLDIIKKELSPDVVILTESE